MKRSCLLLLASLACGLTARAQFTLAETGGTFRSDATNLATSGIAFASSLINGDGYEVHSVAGLNDGGYGNESSWIGDTSTSSAGIFFSSGLSIASFAFGRDNTGTYQDRNAGTYQLAYTTDTGLHSGNVLAASWTSLGSLNYNGVFPDNAAGRHLYNLTSPISNATAFRITTPDGAAIDELELYSSAATLPPANPGASNLNLSGGSVYKSANQFFAQRFVTNSANADPFQLGTVSLNLGVGGAVNNFAVQIRSDLANAPGAVLGTLTGETSPAASGQYDFVNGSVTLEANTSYWVTWGFTDGAGSIGNVQLAGTAHTGDWTFTGVTSSYNDGAAWYGATTGYTYQISVQPLSAVPEPSTYALLAGAAGLGFVAWRRRRSA